MYKLALIVDGQIDRIGYAVDLFPNTSFSDGMPDADFMTAVGAMFVDDNVPFDHATQKIEYVAPFIDGDVVRMMQAVSLTTEELADREASRKRSLLNQITEQAQRALDKFAQDRGYAGIVSVCTYDTSSVPRYAADALRARTLRDQWWEQLNVIVSEVQAGTRPEPTSLNDLLPDLPELTWA